MASQEVRNEEECWYFQRPGAAAAETLSPKYILRQRRHSEGSGFGRQHLDGGESGAQAGAQELVSAEGGDAHKAAEVHQVDALQVVQRQLVVEQLRELHQLVVVHRLSSAHLRSEGSGLSVVNILGVG